MFLSNKYTNIYFNIINRAKSMPRDGYTENHHIIPRSLGGSNDADNLVKLSAREHFLAHRLLCKMTTSKDKGKMYYAFNMMQLSNNNQNRYKKLTSASYAILKEELSKYISLSRKGKKTGPQTKPRKPRPPISDETRRKMSEQRKRLWQSKEYRNNNTRGSYTHTEETKQKISESRKGKPTCLGRKWTEEQKSARSILSKKLMAAPEMRQKISNSKKKTISTALLSNDN